MQPFVLQLGYRSYRTIYTLGFLHWCIISSHVSVWS